MALILLIYSSKLGSTNIDNTYKKMLAIINFFFFRGRNDPVDLSIRNPSGASGLNRTKTTCRAWHGWHCERLLLRKCRENVDVTPVKAETLRKKMNEAYRARFEAPADFHNPDGLIDLLPVSVQPSARWSMNENSLRIMHRSEIGNRSTFTMLAATFS